MKIKVLINHNKYFGILSEIEAELAVIPRIGEFIDPWPFLSEEQTAMLFKHLPVLDKVYDNYTYVRQIHHSFETNGQQIIMLMLDNCYTDNKWYENHIGRIL